MSCCFCFGDKNQISARKTRSKKEKSAKRKWERKRKGGEREFSCEGEKSANNQGSSQTFVTSDTVDQTQILDNLSKKSEANLEHDEGILDQTWMKILQEKDKEDSPTGEDPMMEHYNKGKYMLSTETAKFGEDQMIESQQSGKF